MGKNLVEKLRDNCAVLCLKSFEGFKKKFLLRSFMKNTLNDSTWISSSGIVFTKKSGITEPIDMSIGI